jgi:hypothetical protein
MLYYPNIKTLFFASPSTGSRSLNLFLKRINGDPSASIGYNNTLDIPAGAQYETVIASVANPYTRAFDRWKRRGEYLTKNNRAGEIMPFADFIKTSTYTTLQPVIASVSQSLTEANINTDIVIRLEYIKSDVKLIPGIDLEKNNTHRSAFATHIAADGVVSRASEWKSNYTQEVADIVYAALEKDFTAYNYSKDSWK